MMGLGALCLTGHTKRPARQWLVGLLISALLMAAELTGLFLYYGREFSGSGLITRIPFTYCLLNWLLNADFRMPKAWMAKALRLSSTWIYCSHMLVLSLFHWFYGYLGLTRFILICGLTVVCGIPYIAAKLLLENRKKKQIKTTV